MQSDDTHDPKDHATLAFGCAAVAGLYGELTRADGIAVLEAAWDSGLRRFDTAPFYGRGLSERRVGDVLRDKPRETFTLSTKVGRLLSPADKATREDGALPFHVHFDYSDTAIARSFEDSLQRLGMASIDYLYVHDIGRFAHGDANGPHLENLLSSGIPFLEGLKAQGIIRGWGLGVNEVETCLQVMEATTPDEILLAGRYTLLDRTAEESLLPLCLERGTRLVIGGVFNSGILATGASAQAHFDYGPASDDIRARVDAIEAICTRYGIPMAQAALSFPAAHPAVSHVLIGTGKVSSLRRNLDQFGARLPPGLLDEIAPHVLRTQTLRG
ncbi:aldo/keto reductase [Salipiger sp. IMCC34102]|uniref:aldo/keto reductase n=1 Tax=Salipiger sp. IMCC34102 TaxID=2510647 RepID=UPI00101BC93A|nr:aldo/keto reductase [Salipiger sp. IMCC34102]RYH04268.1 aldo/keto reductase [Salipiger sp. IMCC34102]